jgi:hypothetical protein
VSILPQLERDLYEAALERLPADHRHPGPHRAALVTLLGVAVALAVAVLALSLPAEHRPTAASAALAPPRYLGLHQLLERFAVLRRPQTVTEERFRPSPMPGFIPRFTRLASTLPDGERVFLTVSRVSDRVVGQPVGSYMLSVWLLGADGAVNPMSGQPSYNQLWDYTHFPVLFGADPHGSWIWIGIVPDGVRAVGWVFPPHTFVVPVKGNVAAALLPGATGAVTPKVLWYGAHQQVVERFLAPIKYVLSAGGIAGARFGESELEVVPLLRGILGRPHRRFVPSQYPYLPFWKCDGIDLAVTWQDFDAFFRQGRFVAYTYWEQQVVPTWWPLLATARGMTIGETPAYARGLYGRAFRIRRMPRGSWELTTPGGSLDGFTYGAAFGPRGAITTIQAGTQLCATVSP